MTIQKSIMVNRPPETSFKVFCGKMSEWWPGGFGGKDAKVFLEGRVGGRFFTNAVPTERNIKSAK
jgi:hypothetical protein